MDKQSPSPQPAKRPKLDWRGLTEAGVAVTLAASFVGFLGPLWWCFDLFSHFVAQYAVTLLLAAGVLWAVRRRKFALMSLGGAVFNLALILPFYFGAPPPAASTAKTARVMLMNVETSNRQTQRVIDTIAAKNPDVLVLEEVDVGWLERLKPITDEYPFNIACPRRDNFGIAIFSRLPFVDARIVNIGEAEVPSMIARIMLDHRPWTLIASHPLPPGNAEYARLRNEQLAELPRWIRQADKPVMLLGDLNVTPWSVYFRRLRREGGLFDSMRGRGLQPSWPTFFPIAFVPLDHCLHTEGIVVHSRRVGPHVGSDHLPVIVDFSVSDVPQPSSSLNVSPSG